MRVTVKFNPNPSFCNRSLVTIALSESEFEDLRTAIEMLCTQQKPSEEFAERLKRQYLPKLIAVEAKIDEKYKINRNGIENS